MKMILYNTASEREEARQDMSPSEAEARNVTLRANEEPQRWVPSPQIWEEDTDERP